MNKIMNAVTMQFVSMHLYASFQWFNVLPSSNNLASNKETILILEYPQFSKRTFILFAAIGYEENVHRLILQWCYNWLSCSS